jgi:hypothetical protein
MIPRISQDPADVARYIARLATDLRQMAAGAELDFLAYLIGMVVEEARSEVELRRGAPPGDHDGPGPQTRETR